MWDLTVPGLIYEKVRTEFPHREPRQVQEIEVIAGPEETQRWVRTSERVLFFSQDKETFIQVGPRVLAVNRLKPYLAWAGFKPSIERAVCALVDTVEVKQFQRIGLLYVNRIVIPDKAVDLDKYFEFRPFLGPLLPQNLASFFLGADLPFQDGRANCRVELANAVPESSDTTVFLLRLDYSSLEPGWVCVDRAMEWIEEAHRGVEYVFEGCIRDPLRAVFQEAK